MHWLWYKPNNAVVNAWKHVGNISAGVVFIVVEHFERDHTIIVVVEYILTHYL